MQHVTNEKYELLKSDLKATEKMRSQNFQAILYLLAENQFLKTVLVGLCQKPLETLLREGRDMIQKQYQLNEQQSEQIDQIIEKLVGRR